MTPEHSARAIDRYTGPVIRLTEQAGRLALLLMVVLITVDVVLRYFFNRPIKGSYELVEFMMVFLVFSGLAFTQQKKSHVAVSLLTEKLSPGTNAVLSSITGVLCFAILALVSWRSIVQAESVRTAGTCSGVLFIPHYPFMWVVAAGAVLLTVQYLIDVLRAVDGVREHCRRPWVWFCLGACVVAFLGCIPLVLEWVPWNVTRIDAGLLGIALLIGLLFTGMAIGPVMALIGFLGFSYLVNPEASLAVLGTSPYTTSANQAMSTIPLFMLMGLLCFHSEISADIYTTLRYWLGRLPGGLAMSTVGGCAGFAAVSGSSLATAVTMGTIALPEMRRYRYADSLACGAIASGGTIGILIPPSFAFIVYASLTEESIGKLFIAGIIPGVMQAVFYMATIYLMCRVKPELGPPGPSSTLREKIVSLKGTWGILVLFSLVIGGIYAGVFTPTEAAGVGCFGAFLIGLFKGKLSVSKVWASLSEAGRNTAMLMLMLIGAEIFGYFLTRSQIPFKLAEFVVGMDVPSAVTIWAILGVYVILGCVMPILPAIILTVPIFFPIVTGLGYDPIWFGVLVVTMAEMGQITPPVGINVFVLAGVAKDVSLGTIFKGIVPFIVTDVVRIAITFFFPAITLWLPSLMGG